MSPPNPPAQDAAAVPAAVRAAGILMLVGRSPQPTHFLLMQHAKRWDLPKGHCDGDESFLETAIRETTEETGIDSNHYIVDQNFQFDLHYTVEKKRYGKTPVQKHVRYFLAWTDRQHQVEVTEHIAYQWFQWQPPHTIQPQTIDPLLAAATEHLAANK